MCILRLRPHSWQPGPAENSSGVCRHAARLFVVALLCLLSPQLGWAQAVLENPQPASFQSGIGLISGWACEATSIEIQFDRRLPVEAASGTDRGDTRGPCGDTDNGFGLPFNWNLLGAGEHTVRALADGVAFASVTVTVTTLGEEFLRGASGEFTLADFPRTGVDVQLRWQEAQQNFVLTDGRPPRGGGTGGSAPAVLENPAPGSFQSGIGIISGWVCEAAGITLQFDSLLPVEAAYGTSREDTRGACGDTDNGFGLLFNWNLLGAGLHTVRALADGVEFASVEVVVTTLGVEFLRGASGEFTLSDFPQEGTEVIVQWQEAQQNFVLTQVQLPPKIYWTEDSSGSSGPENVRRANLDGSETETLVSGVNETLSLALDVAGGKMYWTDPGSTSRIQRANLDGSRIETLVTTRRISGKGSGGLALDLTSGKMYWGEGFSTIKRANLDGSHIETLVHETSFPPGTDTHNLALDLAGGKMYWGGNARIRRANLDGSQLETIHNFSQYGERKGLALDTVGGKLYWTDQHGNIGRVNLDGSQAEILRSGFTDLQGLALDTAAGKLYWLDKGVPGTLYRANLDGSQIEIVRSQLESPRGLALDTASAKLYWTKERAGIQRATLDGSQLETLVTNTSGVNSPYGIALDLVAGKLYWTNGARIGESTTIQRANLNGSQAEIVIVNASSPVGLALDLANDKLYWTEPRAGKILRATLDGFEIETLLRSPSPQYLALDVAGGKLYWTNGRTFDKYSREYTNGSIQRANLDGSQLETLVSPAEGAVSPQGLALDVAAGKLYWADANKRSLYRANLDGTQVLPLLGTEGSPLGLALDVAAGKLYWTDSDDSLHRANLDGTGVELLLEDLHNPRGIALGIE